MGFLPWSSITANPQFSPNSQEPARRQESQTRKEGRKNIVIINGGTSGQQDEGEKSESEELQLMWKM
ncbi:hypothetical protein EYF80_055362 [Liparis tanakae]|uniref:Uncharacterized protein n=1 Tax=Liparis tanakae TaxID=230148 RepID=A0A4Z2F0T8_9TELE|nr:hypothetical protein EYF80_055362 [Liparis tanakae]